MTRRLLLGYLSITTLAILVLGIPLGVVFARAERTTLVASVRRDASRLATFAALPLAGQRSIAVLQRAVDEYARATEGRVVVVDGRGTSLADSGGEPGRRFTSRPEIDQALRGVESAGFRDSATLGQRLLFVAQPVNSGGTILGAVRITYPAAIADARIHRSWLTIAAVGIAIVAAVAAVSVLVARSVTAPVHTLGTAATRLGEGDLSARADPTAGPNEIRLLASLFNDTADKLESLVHAQQAFVADASHQLRTPLAALRLRLENLAAKTRNPAERRDTSAALEEVARLSRLVDGLLVLARTDSTPPAARALDVDTIVEKRRSAWAPLAAEREVGLAVEGTAGRARITPDSLEQELDNLIANALDASPAGTEVTISLHRDEQWVVVSVLDHGPGMSEADRVGAFDRFLSRKHNGTGFGLGLAIAHRLARRDGGDLTLTAAPGGGLRADIRLVATL